MLQKSDLDNKEDRSFFKTWLEQLQQDSWQLELIISGFALYGIVSARSSIIEFSYFLKDFPSSFIQVFTIILQVGWTIFFINLLIHVILRSLWIGAIGLRYISKDIDYEELGYNEKFTTFLSDKIGDYDDFIERLENICSVIFSYTFLLFLLFISICALILFVVPFGLVIEYLGDDNFKYFGIFLVIYLFLGFLVFIDFVTTGGIRRIEEKWVARFYFPLYRFFSFISLSFLYRPLLYNFLDNKYTRRFFYFSFPYIFLIAINGKLITGNAKPHFISTLSSKSEAYTVDDLWYEDKTESLIANRGREEVRKISLDYIPVVLSEFEIYNDYASFFIPINESDYNLLNDVFGVTPLYKEGWRFGLSSRLAKDENKDRIVESETDSLLKLYHNYKLRRDYLEQGGSIEKDILKEDSILHTINMAAESVYELKKEKLETYNEDRDSIILAASINLFEVSIDETSYQDSLHCFFYKRELNNAKGMKCIFPTKQLKTGLHHMNIERKIYREKKIGAEKKDTFRTDLIKLPFVKQ